jgi:hypothetical protein
MESDNPVPWRCPTGVNAPRHSSTGATRVSRRGRDSRCQGLDSGLPASEPVEPPVTYLNWLSCCLGNWKRLTGGRPSRLDWHAMQVRTPGTARCRPSGFPCAFHTMRLALVRRQMSPRKVHAVRDSVVDLLLNRSVRRLNARRRNPEPFGDSAPPNTGFHRQNQMRAHISRQRLPP